jgi:hypothetical protein
MTAWREEYEKGGPETERLDFERLALEIMQVQMKVKQRARRANIQRAFHAKAVYTAVDAELCFVDDLPADLHAGFAQPGKRYPAIVRLSNANGDGQADVKRDLRGMALRVKVGDEVAHDLLATNYPVSHARNARQFVAFAKATAGGTLDKIVGLIALSFEFGARETVRMLRNVMKARRTVPSLALETYWSRGAIRWGETLAVRYQFRPAADAPSAPPPATHDPDFLSREFAHRLDRKEVRFDLCLQRFVDARTTPIEDTAVEWNELAAPPVKVATLVLSKPRTSANETLAEGRMVEELAFNPWNTTEEFRPLGNLNRARKAVYDASSAHRLGYRWVTVTPLRNRILAALIPPVFTLVNRFIPWHKLPLRLSLLNLDAFRFVLRRKNLIDTEVREAPPQARPVPAPVPEDVRRTRQADGRYTDVSAAEMGAAGASFGRNLPPILRTDLFDTPSPIRVSRELLQRKEFIPARSLNILAAAWIQFQVHDWVNHARYPLGQDDVVLQLPPNMTWRSSVSGPEEAVMRIAGNTDRIAQGPGRPPIYFRNTETHWWDSSQIYGSDAAMTKSLREGPKIRLEKDYLPLNVNGFEVAGFNQSWWLGLSAMHLLFVREHNLLCDELRTAYRDWDDERIFNTARLIVSALIAKIHTVEWTPAILATKAIDVALNINWNGPPPKDWRTRAGLWMLDVHALTGIPKSTPDHSGVPYSLTEDFVTVYRLHPLIPDDYCFFDHTAGRKIADKTFLELQGVNTDRVMRETGLANVLYSLGIAYPGAITLHNFPNSLMKFERDGELIDLSVVDLVRTRRRGVPRYNDFLRGLHKPRVRRWEDLTADPEDVRLLRDIYQNDLDLVDTVVGLFGETPPEGFGFSDTAFRIFILMASRRLQSDRFLTVDFRPEIYSPLGMDWIANSGMKSVIQRHCPELAPLLPSDASAFAPWRVIVPRS